jgi:hypothetical protein
MDIIIRLRLSDFIKDYLRAKTEISKSLPTILKFFRIGLSLHIVISMWPTVLLSLLVGSVQRRGCSTIGCLFFMLCFFGSVQQLPDGGSKTPHAQGVTNLRGDYRYQYGQQENTNDPTDWLAQGTGL